MHGSLENVPDTMNSQGAMALAMQIQRFWNRHKLAGVKVWIEPIRTFDDELGKQVVLFQVRSNITERLRACLS